MVDWAGRLEKPAEPVDGMSGDEILAAFDRLIAQQEPKHIRR